MAERKCVVVRDFDVTAASVPFDRVLELAGDPPEDTVLIFWMDTVFPDGKKNAKWRKIPRGGGKKRRVRGVPSPAETASCLSAPGAAAPLRPENARLLFRAVRRRLHRLLGAG